MAILFTFGVFVALFVLNALGKIHIRLNVVSFIGIVLMIIFLYLELLTIRDHLWVLEGSLTETKRWRDTFFNQKSLRAQKIRKFGVLLFSSILFTVIYYRLSGATELFSFLGTILMLTVLYFEVLSIRDDVQELLFELKARKFEEIVKVESLTEAKVLPTGEADLDDMAPKDEG
ncbi:MAG: hypothetical protein HQM08_03495 [Candidatus Riflebacteria bacterium]|nr:hypothetical protein [Candidatus Riflebacteria bacterium]